MTESAMMKMKISAVSDVHLENKQECIPVGCVPPAAIAVHGRGVSASVHCWDTHLPLGVGLETPLARPLNFAPECGPGDPPPPENCCKACWDNTCKACWDTTPLWTDRHV